MANSNTARLDSVFHALSDATRRAILRDVADGEKPVGEIARPFALTLAAVSKHIQVLEAAELIARERRGRMQIVRLRAGNLREAEEWLTYYERFWTDRLDSLQVFLEAETDAKAGKGDENG